MTESKVVEGKTTKKGKTKKVGFIKMKVISDLKSHTIIPIVEECICQQAVLTTDYSTSNVRLKDVVAGHQAQVIPKKKVGEVLPWVHIAISTAKRLILNAFHDIKPEYLQNYLDEFCYNFNRRDFGEATFDRLLIASVTNKNHFRYN